MAHSSLGGVGPGGRHRNRRFLLRRLPRRRTWRVRRRLRTYPSTISLVSRRARGCMARTEGFFDLRLQLFIAVVDGECIRSVGGSFFAGGAYLMQQKLG